MLSSGFNDDAFSGAFRRLPFKALPFRRLPFSRLPFKPFRRLPLKRPDGNEAGLSREAEPLNSDGLSSERASSLVRQLLFGSAPVGRLLGSRFEFKYRCSGRCRSTESPFSVLLFGDLQKLLSLFRVAGEQPFSLAN